MDAEFGAQERAKIGEMVENRFGLSATEVGALLEAADEKVEQSVEVFGFTREIKNAFSPEERIQMMEMLWEVAYADGALHDLEASLMRRLAGLLHVSDRDSGLARKRGDRKSTRLNSSQQCASRMPSSACKKTKTSR